DLLRLLHKEPGTWQRALEPKWLMRYLTLCDSTCPKVFRKQKGAAGTDGWSGDEVKHWCPGMIRMYRDLALRLDLGFRGYLNFEIIIIDLHGIGSGRVQLGPSRCTLAALAWAIAACKYDIAGASPRGIKLMDLSKFLKGGAFLEGGEGQVTLGGFSEATIQRKFSKGLQAAQLRESEGFYHVVDWCYDLAQGNYRRKAG
ncbi:unnamed protein product, partial [Effrenium voratum]